MPIVVTFSTQRNEVIDGKRRIDFLAYHYVPSLLHTYNQRVLKWISGNMEFSGKSEDLESRLAWVAKNRGNALFNIEKNTSKRFGFENKSCVLVLKNIGFKKRFKVAAALELLAKDNKNEKEGKRYKKAKELPEQQRPTEEATQEKEPSSTVEGKTVLPWEYYRNAYSVTATHDEMGWIGVISKRGQQDVDDYKYSTAYFDEKEAAISAVKDYIDTYLIGGRPKGSKNKGKM